MSSDLASTLAPLAGQRIPGDSNDQQLTSATRNGVRFIGTSTTSFRAIVAIGNGPQTRVDHNPRNRLPWHCDKHGHQPGPDCSCADLADANNMLRQVEQWARQPRPETTTNGTTERSIQ